LYRTKDYTLYREGLELVFKDLLKCAGITKAELSRRFQITPRAVSKWGNNPPIYAQTYLKLLIEYNKIQQKQGEKNGSEKKGRK